MKILRAAALACLLLLSACKKESTTDTASSVNNAVPVQTNDVLQKLATALDGLWISNSYLENIEKTKSIYKSKDYGTVNRLFGFTLYRDSLATGKTELLGFSEHEGGIVYPLLYNDAKKRLNYDPKRAREFDGPMELSLYPVKGNLIEISYAKPKSQKDRFRKIGDSKSDIDQLDETLNTILFEGKYADSINGNGVHFTIDGKVHGMTGYDHYYLLYDFGEGLEFDTVFLWQGESNGERETYHFKIEGKTLRLYATDINEQEMVYTIREKPSFVFIH